MAYLNKYNILLQKSPIITRAITSFVIALTGDYVCQRIECSLDGKSFTQNYSFQRTLNISIFTSTAITPGIYFWFKFLAKRFPGTGLKPLLKKIVMDRLISGPACVLGFFISQPLMNGNTLKDVEYRIRHNYFTAVKMGTLTFTISNLVNFQFVALRYQVLFSNLIGFFWNMYLSYIIHKNKIKELEFFHQAD